jgi:hypothetical protein
LSTDNRDYLRIGLDNVDAELKDRLVVSRGTESAVLVNDGGPSYEEGAIVPHRPWGAIDESRDQIGVPDSNSSTCSCIWIIKIPDAMTRSFKEASCGLSSQRHANELMRNAHVAKGLSQIRSYCLDYLSNTENFKTQGVSVRQPGLVTTTIDVRKNLRIGIHMDSWDQCSIYSRAGSRNRLNVNLGSGSRFLIVGTTSIAEIATQIEPDLVSSLGPTELTREWYRRNPESPLYRIEVKPNEAYIAPTESLPHDSSTETKDDIDISFTMLGHFSGRPVS